MKSLILLMVIFGCKTQNNALESKSRSVNVAVSAWEKRFGFKLIEESSEIEIFDFLGKPLTPACVMGLRHGDTIKSLNGISVDSIASLGKVADANIAGPYEYWCFEVLRGGQNLKLPFSCDFAATLANKALEFASLCQPGKMYQCGLPAQCQTKESK